MSSIKLNDILKLDNLNNVNGAVAKRMFGPVGVAILVVSFGLCLYQAAHN